MKQVLLLGDQNIWQAQTIFVHDLLNFTGLRVMVVNIGQGKSTADLDVKDVRYLFEADSLAGSITKLTNKLYSQGAIDGIVCLGGADNPACWAAFAALPFGIPKVQADYGCRKTSADVTWFQLPGTVANFNPVQKIALSNAVFAISGMTLNNICNYGTSQAVIALVGADNIVAEWLANQQYHFICFEVEDPMLPVLIKDGYVHGALFIGWSQSPALSQSLEAAATRDIPLVLAVAKSDLPAAQLSPVNCCNLIIAYPGSGKIDGRCAPVKHAYGSVKFCLAAAGMLNQMLL